MNKEIVEEKYINERLDKVVCQICPELSRAIVQKQIEENHIKVNGNKEKTSYKVKIGDFLEIEPLQAKEVDIQAEEIPLDILYEDGDIIVINKEKGMVVHPANGNLEHTLVNALMAKCKGSLSGIGGEIRPGIVHRLDKDTSGIIVVAKNDKAHIHLSEQLKNHEMKKTYIALVRGEVEENEATINIPIGRSKKDRKKMDVDKNGKTAVTHFKVLKRYQGYTLLEIKIDTGRTHQIRVHLSYIGHPIIGDGVYSNGKNPFGVVGQMLHAKQLEFAHPILNKKIKIEAPLPGYFQEVLKELEKNQPRHLKTGEIYINFLHH